MVGQAAGSGGDIPTRIARVELRCSDVEQSADFYRRLVGLEASEVGLEHAALRAPDGGEPILVLRRAERAGAAPRAASGLFHTAFRFRDRPALGAALRRIASEMAYPITGASDHGVSEAIYLDDPDGLGIELYRDRPRAEWPQPAAGEAVRMFTEPLDLDGVASADSGAAPAEASAGVDVGHVHLKVADPEGAAAFWQREVGMELMTRFGRDAVFLALDGYHHHVGANSWMSRGADLEPAEGPGLAAVAVRAGQSGRTLETPDGVPVLLEGAGS
jgi:catechol 2,3-dioxygenase